MTCEKAVDWMQRSLDHDLDDSEREAMLAHISRCSECTEMYTRLQQLSLELARLPKVMPPISLVDAILPRLDEIDRLRSESAQGVTEGQTSAAHHASPAGWLGRLKRMFPLGAVGGVVAAGVMLALFITNQDGVTKQQADDATLMRQSQETASSKRSNASEAASQQDRQLASKITSGSAGSQAAASGSASTTSPVAPMLQEPAGGPTPSSTPVPISGGSSQPLLIAPTPSSTFTPAEGKGESKGDGVSITGAPRPTGSAELSDPNTNATNAANASNASNASNSTNASNAANASSTTEGPAGGEIADKFDASSEPPIGTPDPNAETPGSISNKSAPGTTGSGSVDDKSKNGPATVTPSPERPPMGLTALPPVLRLASPDGQYLAIYDTVSHRVTIKSSDEKTLVYASEQVWAELDAVRLNRWASATSVSYTVVQGESEKTFLIDIVKKQETAETDAK